MAKTPSKKSSSPSKNKGKALSAKPVAKSSKPAIVASKANTNTKKAPAASAKVAPAPVKKSAAAPIKAAPGKAVVAMSAKTVATTPVKAVAAPGKATVVGKTPVVAKAPAGKPVAKPKQSAKAIIEANRPAPIMLVPRTPSNGKSMVPAVTIKPGKKAKEKKPVVEPAYRPPLQESVPTDGKPRKNQAGLLTKELEHFRDLLLEKRREIVGDMSSMEREALRSGVGGLSSLPVHMADMGTDNYEQEFTLGLVEKDRNLLRDLNAALAKVQNGTYGLCEGTGKPINKVRLEAQPWAKFSIEWARQLERQRGLR